MFGMTTTNYTFTHYLVDGSKVDVKVDGKSMKDAVYNWANLVVGKDRPEAMTVWVRVTGRKTVYPVTNARWGHAYSGYRG